MNIKTIILYPLLIAHCSLLIAPSLYALGKKDTVEPNPLNNKWILCITAFDYSLLPDSRRIVGEVITRNLVDRLKNINYRIRLSPEYAYYETYAWQQSINTTARAISQRQDERSQLLYRGEPARIYQRNLQRIDGEIAKLTEQLAERENEKPLINTEPVFELSSININGSYPAIPKTGTEHRFCKTQNVDAFLTGQMRELHGRFYLKLRLYILYANSFVYEDDIVFSREDTDSAVDEISTRLITVLSGSRPALVAIKADPPDSQILINRNYAGKGLVEAQERPPGKITVSVAADGFTPESLEVEIAGGELADINVSLGPLQYADVNISVPGKTDISVYHGSLYVGEAPLTLRLPINQLEYIYVETMGRESARAVINTPDMYNEMVYYSLKTKIPPPQGEKRLNKARSRYYWAWAGTWVALLATWITSGINTGQYNGINLGYAYNHTYDPGFVDSASMMNKINTGAAIALGVSGAYTIYQIIHYIYTANEGSTPIAKRGRK